MRVGLRRGLTLELMVQRMLGSARMVLDTGRHPASLRDDVAHQEHQYDARRVHYRRAADAGRRQIRCVPARGVEEAMRIVVQQGEAAQLRKAAILQPEASRPDR